jgi:hypothetical protein
MATADVENRIEIGRLTVQVHEYDCGRPPAATHPRLEGFGEQCRIHVPGHRLAVDQHRSRAQVQDRVDARRERQRGHQHFVTRLNADGHQSQMEGSRAGAHRDSVRSAGQRAELLFERVNVRAERCNPVACDGVGNQLPFEPGQVGWRQVNSPVERHLRFSVGWRLLQGSTIGISQ